MIGRVLFAYLFRRFLFTAALFASGVALLLVVIEFIELTRAFGSLPRYSTGTALVGALLKAPFTLQAMTPYVVVISAMVCLASLNRRSELVSMWSAGLSAWQVVWPMCLAAVLIGLLAVFALSPLVARTMVETQRIQAKIQGFPEPRDWPAAMPWMTQRSAEGTLIFGARSTERRGLVLIDATFLKFGPEERFVERIDTPRAVLDMDMWRLTNAVRIAADGTVDQLGESAIRSTLRSELFQQRQTNPDLVSFFALSQTIDMANAIGAPTARFRTRFHVMLASPFLLAGLVLASAAASMQFSREGLAKSLVFFSLAGSFALFVSSVVLNAVSSADAMSPVLAAWLPVAAAIAAGGTGILYIYE